tara:strand:- start:4270 stop:4506 length:237 start_codon:yes stop_codon:yes gene_type:complete
MNPGDINTFSITFKSTNEGYAYILSFIESYTEYVSDRVLPDTDNMYEADDNFKKLVKMVKKAKADRDTYTNKNNHKHK